MRYLKMLGLACLSVMALMAFVIPASATTLEVGGIAKNESLTIEASLVSGGSVFFRNTSGTIVNTCATSQVKWKTENNFTTTKVTGGVQVLNFSTCARSVIVDEIGQLYVEHIASTTNGTVYSENAKITVVWALGTTTCTTGAGTDLGTLEGVVSGHAILNVNAVLNCSPAPNLTSVKWEGSYTVTSPTGLGVSA